ncbi:hypothetical protein BJ508DRAFT_146403 [Ascobolus immersus RN42]|uniref:Uncharacterized protein n=1 Tax=Ascobolus immersus RN42 TaxID=1160509 RepID=A0A3N4IKD2_ASCIM|nr:hypothetical protein BJ508DRAFT_146403 [Ascobolus immersus RN42]
MSGSQRPYHNYPQYGSTDQRAPQPPPPPPPPHPPVQRAPVAYVTPVRQQAPFPPNINSPTPNGQAPAPPLRTPNAQYGTSSSHYFDPLERPVERPQPPAKITTPSSSWGYNSYHAQPPVPSPTASHHGNVYDVIRDRPIEPVTRPQAPQAPQAPSLPINAPRAPQAPKAPQAPVAAVAPVNPPTPRTPTELKQHNGAPWASKKAQPASSQRRDGAMSISSLLSNPASDTREQTSPPPIETPTRSMAKVVETEARNGHIPHSHSGKTPGKQTASKAPAYNPPVSIPQAKHHRHTTEKEHSQPQSQSQSQSHSQSTQDSFKKSSSFKDFKYHDSMNIDHAESERVDDTDVDEEVYADALNRYKVNRQKRKLGLMTEEAEIRKVRPIGRQMGSN